MRVVDNFEHVLSGVMLVAKFLGRCVSLRLLCTNRSALDSAADQVTNRIAQVSGTLRRTSPPSTRFPRSCRVR